MKHSQGEQKHNSRRLAILICWMYEEETVCKHDGFHRVAACKCRVLLPQVAEKK